MPDARIACCLDGVVLQCDRVLGNTGNKKQRFGTLERCWQRFGLGHIAGNPCDAWQVFRFLRIAGQRACGDTVLDSNRRTSPPIRPVPPVTTIIIASLLVGPKGERARTFGRHRSIYLFVQVPKYGPAVAPQMLRSPNGMA